MRKAALHGGLERERPALHMPGAVLDLGAQQEVTTAMGRSSQWTESGKAFKHPWLPVIKARDLMEESLALSEQNNFKCRPSCL